MAEATQAPFKPQNVYQLKLDPTFKSLPPEQKMQRILAQAKTDADYNDLSNDERQEIINELLAGEQVQPLGAATTGAQRAAEGSMSIPEAAGREALAVGTGALGSVGDIANFPGAVSGMLGGPTYHLPIGTEDIQKAVGFQPVTGAERVGQTVGGFMGPGAWLKLAGKLGLNENTVKALQALTTTGSTAHDVALGTASGIGGEAARSAFPGSPMAPAVGSAATALGAAGLQSGLSGALKLAGKRTVKKQAIEGMEGQLEEVQRATREAQSTAEATRSAGRQAQREVSAESRGLTGAAKEGAAAAEGAVQEHFQPLEEELAQSILKTKTTAGTERVIPPTFPSAAEAGQAAQGELAAEAPRIAEAAQAEATRLLDSVGPDIGRIETLAKAKTGMRAWHAAEGQATGKLFDATEAITGDQAVFSPTKLGAQSRYERYEAGKAAIPTPPGTQQYARMGGRGLTEQEQARLAETGITPGTPQTESPSGLVDPYGHPVSAREPSPGTAPVTENILRSTPEIQELLLDPMFRAKLTETQQQTLDAILADKGATKIPFWVARRIESRLGEIAYRGAQPVGTLTQGVARRMLRALRDDMSDFYLTDIGQEIKGEGLDEAKARWREFVQVSNRSIVSRLLANDDVAAAQFLSPFTSTSKSPQSLAQIDTVMRVASDDVKNTLRGYTMGEIYRDAQASGQFDLSTMLQKLQALRRSGKMDAIFEPEQVASINRYMHEQTAANADVLAGFKKKIANAPSSGVVDVAFPAGKIEQTQNFQAAVSPDTFDANIKVWARQFMERLPEMTAEEKYQALKPFVYRDAGTPSQLDIMLTEYPGVSDRITAMVESYKPGAAKLAAKQAQATSAAEVGKAETAQVREVTQAQVDAANASLRGLKAEGADLQDRIRAAKRELGLDEGISVHSYLRVGGTHFRTGSFLGIGLTEILASIATGHPAAALVGVGIAGGGPMWRAFTNSPTGRRVIREGLQAHYGLPATRFAVEALGGAPAE